MAAVSLFRSFHHRNFALFFSGQIISLVGTWMQSVAESAWQRVAEGFRRQG